MRRRGFKGIPSLILIGILSFSNGCRFPSDSAKSDLLFNSLVLYTLTWQDLCGPLATESSVIQPLNFARFKSYLAYQASLGSSAPPTAALIGAVMANPNYEGMTLTRTGKLFSVSRVATFQMLQIDATQTPAAVSFVPPVGTANGDSGGFLTPSGTVIFYPQAQAQILEFDPVTNTSNRSGTSAGVQCAGGTFAPNGKAYCAPVSGGTNKVLEIDPATRNGVAVGNAFGATAFVDAALTGYGTILLNPQSYTSIVELDLTTYAETSIFSATGLEGLIMAPNGHLVGAPNGGTVFVDIDPVTRTAYTFAKPGGAYSGGALAPNGKIYFAPRSGTIMVEYDSSTRVMNQYSVPAGGYVGMKLAPNGRLYAAPVSGASAQVIEINPHANGSFCDNVMRSAYLNHW
jgi:streptogramin lyase